MKYFRLISVVVLSAITLSGLSSADPVRTGGGSLLRTIQGTGDNQALLWNNTTKIWYAGAVSSAAGGTVTNVSSANADISVANPTTTPTLTLNSGTSANQIVKLNVSAQLPAVDGSLLTGLTKAQVGLGAVENTALSTWAGSTNITTLGTIATGTVPWANVGSGGQPLDTDLTTLSALGNWRIPYTNGSSAMQSTLQLGDQYKLLMSNGASAAPTFEFVGTDSLSSNAVTTAKINDNAVTPGKLANPFTAVDGTTIFDFSGITQSASTDEGIAIPLWADVAPTSDKPWLTWDATGNQFKVYDGGWVTVGGSGGGGGAPTDAQYLVMALDGTLSAERAVTATSPVTFTAASATSAVIAIDNASSTARGVVELATNSEAQAGTANGSSGPLAVTPGNLVAFTGSSNISTVGTVTSGTWNSTIQDNIIVNADINSSAAIDTTKIGDGSVNSTEWGYLGATTASGAALMDDASASAQRTTLGLGTIATQAASSVSITGGTMDSVTVTKGTIDNTVIGGTTKAAGTFTTITVDNLAIGTSTPDGSRYLELLNNSSISGTSGKYQIYFDGGVLKYYEGTTERIPVNTDTSATFTGTTYSFAATTNFAVPVGTNATADATGEIAIDTDDEQFQVYVNGATKRFDFSGDASGYVLKSNGSGTLTLQADVSGSNPTLDNVANPAGDTTLTFDADKELNLQFTGNFTTGAQVRIQQVTGDPSGGTLLHVLGADSNVALLRVGSNDNTNYINVDVNGMITNTGTSSGLTMGGLILGDSTPDTSGEIGFSGGLTVGATLGSAGTLNLRGSSNLQETAQSYIYFQTNSGGADTGYLGINNDGRMIFNSFYGSYWFYDNDSNENFTIDPIDTQVTFASQTGVPKIVLNGMYLELQNGAYISNSTDNVFLINENSEDLQFTFTDNNIALSSSTGVTTLSSNLAFATTGVITGKVNVIETGDNTTLTDAQAHGSMVFVTAARTITLPAVAAAGYSVCVQAIGAVSVIVDVDSTDGIRLNGATRDTPGDGVVSSGTAGDQICLISDSASGWTTTGRQGTWTSQ